MREHDTVVLTRALPDHGLEVGDVGVLVHVYDRQRGYEVEFLSGGGRTIAVVTLDPRDIRPLSEREILHTRRVCA
ncbi:DUF4926 domain-containing protein [Planctomycetota bacterium]